MKSLSKLLKIFKMDVMEVNKRGALIVFEGCDRVGKTTQSKDLVNLLNKSGHKAAYINFPARDTPCGSLINSYLKNSLDIGDESIHLLFSLNRWEAKNKMLQLLNNGTNLIVDRYSYSGVAFSSAKGLDFDWCKAPEAGLLKPDLVLFLTLTSCELTDRKGFGDERYETLEFQKKVKEIYLKLKDSSYWVEINADKSQNDLLHEIAKIVIKAIEQSQDKPIGTLW